MNVIIRNTLVLIAGILIGMAVNMALVTLGSYLIPAPGDADATTMEGLRESMHLFRPWHFLFPFLAHALGTFAGAFVAARFVATRNMLFAIIVGLFFLAGGIFSVLMLPSPLWYTLVDLVLAYLPFAYLAGRLAGYSKRGANQAARLP